MLADHGEKIGPNYPKFNSTAKNEFSEKIASKIATVSNPSDYTTPIWGIPDKTYPVFLKIFNKFENRFHDYKSGLS